MRFIKILFVTLALGFAATMPACSCDNGLGHGDGGMRPFGDGSVSIGSITIAPADVTLDLNLMTGTPVPASQTFVVTYHDTNVDKDVSNDANTLFTLADITLGAMNGPNFTSSTDHGGTTTLVASYTPPGGTAQTAQATIHVRVHGTFIGPNCTGCGAFPPDTAPACAAGAEATVVYPSEGVLLPPNLDSLEVQFTPGAGDTLFEVDFKNPASDVRIVTKCTPTLDTRMNMSGGCQLDLSLAMWDFIAKSNKGGDPLVVTVRASTDGMCASPSKNMMHMSVAEQDIAGGIYYWKSTVVPGGGTGGNIWRKTFGDATPEAEISPTGLNNCTCYGCHFLSRDGTRMTVSCDDNDSDDEYRDVSMGDVDVGNKKYINAVGYNKGQTPGFQTFNHDHSLYLSSDGNGSLLSQVGGGGTAVPGTNVFFEWNGNTAAAATPPFVTLGAAADRPTMPDWSADDKTVVYVLGTKTGWNDGTQREDDAHVYGGSLWTAPYNGMGMFGAPTELIHSMGENNYYPSYSPDGAFIVFNRVPLTGAVGSIDACANGFCPNDSFSNPKARVLLLGTGTGATSLDLELANGSPAAMPVDVSNSWPRWSPFVQTYKGSKLLWITFSSTRDYGLRVRNHVKVNGNDQIQCYPPDSAELPNQGHGTPFADNCQQPQIWMAAINLTTAEVTNPTDPSFPAFWLPFQDITTHNHAAQWTQQVITQPPPDGGACIMGGADCTKDPSNCCGGLVCTANGTCGIL